MAPPHAECTCGGTSPVRLASCFAHYAALQPQPTKASGWAVPAFAFVMLGCPYVYNTRCSAYYRQAADSCFMCTKIYFAPQRNRTII